MCAGQGRDLLGVLAHHPRRDEVRARLVELDEHNARLAGNAAREAGLRGVEVVTADAAITDHYLGMAPADLLLACGVFRFTRRPRELARDNACSPSSTTTPSATGPAAAGNDVASRCMSPGIES